MNTEEKVQVLKWIYSGRSYRDSLQQFGTHYPGRPLPALGTISNLVKKFEETGSVHRAEREPIYRVSTEETRTEVLGLFAANPKSSVLVRSAEYQSLLSTTF